MEFSSWFGAKPPIIPGFILAEKNADIFIKHQNDVPSYTRVRRLYNPQTGTLISIRHRPTGTLLQPLKCTVIAQDVTGITPTELLSIVKAFDGKHRITLAEYAFDFLPRSGVDLAFVNRYGVFGKSRPEKKPKFPKLLRYGTRKSSRFIRAYLKEQINAFRVEVQISSRRLRESDSTDRTICRLGSLRIFPTDILFAAMDWAVLDAFLRKSGRCRTIYREAKKHAESMCELLRYLREVGIRNPDRFLRSLKINLEVARAWRHWTRKFSFKSTIRRKINEQRTFGV